MKFIRKIKEAKMWRQYLLPEWLFTATTARRSNIKLTSGVINEHDEEDIDY